MRAVVAQVAHLRVVAGVVMERGLGWGLPVDQLVHGYMCTDLAIKPAELAVSMPVGLPRPRPAVVGAAHVDVVPQELDTAPADLLRVVPSGLRHAVEASHPVARRAKTLAPLFSRAPACRAYRPVRVSHDLLIAGGGDAHV